jgi:hypothetical protein
MSYFRKIVERTLTTAEGGSLKPAITPDSIPERFEIKSRAGAPARRTTAFNTSGSAKKEPAGAVKPAPRAKAAGEEERLPEQVVRTADAAAPVSPVKQVAQPAPQDKADAPDPDMMADNEQAEVRAEEKTDFAAAATTPVSLHAASDIGAADPASQTKPLLLRGIVSNDIRPPEHHPQLRPAIGSDDKYSVAVTEPDETIVTINIGRIEVRAVSPVVEARSPPRMEFSPSLSLDQYLKQRMEGSKKK